MRLCERWLYSVKRIFSAFAWTSHSQMLKTLLLHGTTIEPTKARRKQSKRKVKWEYETNEELSETVWWRSKSNELNRTQRKTKFNKKKKKKKYQLTSFQTAQKKCEKERVCESGEEKRKIYSLVERVVGKRLSKQNCENNFYITFSNIDVLCISETLRLSLNLRKTQSDLEVSATSGDEF